MDTKENITLKEFLNGFLTEYSPAEKLVRSENPRNKRIHSKIQKIRAQEKTGLITTREAEAMINRMSNHYKNDLTEGTNSFTGLKKNKVALTKEERAEVMKHKAVWHFNGGSPSPAVWKSVNKKGKTTYVTHTHRAYNTASTLKGAIGRFHSFIKGTA